jgi:MFS transporter, ACS family, D-galactonate transporter
MTPAEIETTAEVSAAEPRLELKDSPKRWWLMGLLVTAMLICYAHRGALSVAAPFMIEDLGLSKTVMGILLSAFFWMYAFMQMPTGWLVDRFGVRRAYALGFVIWSVASILTGLVKNLSMLISLRVLLGLGQAVAFPASARAVANWFQERERGTVTGLYLAGVRYGTALINAVGAWFLMQYDWRLFFLVIGALPLIWLFPWTRFLGKWEVTRTAVVSSEAPSHQSTSFLKSLLLLSNRNVFGIFLGFFAYDYAWFVYLSWLPGYLILERNFTPREMGIYSAVPYLTMSVIILISGILSDWLVRRGFEETRVRKIFIVTGLFIGCLIVPAGMVEDKMTAVWLLTISLGGIGIASPNTWTLTQAVCEKKIVGTVSGIQNFGGNLGGVIAPVLTGYIANKTGSFALALSLTGVVLIVGIIAYLTLIRGKVEVEEVISQFPQPDAPH